jgi:peptidyl-prolyl cis-trans isomerase A (cyclophilin A)
MSKSTTLLVLLLILLPLPVAAQDYVCLETNRGEMCLRLYPEFAPVTVANFLSYVDGGHYTGTLIHRSTVVEADGIGVIQAGGFKIENQFITEVMANAPIVLENRLQNRRGRIAMARLGGQPNSATNQWFINVTDNLGLDATADGGYAVFGEIVLGIEVAEHINGLPRYNLAQLGSAFGQVPLNLPNLQGVGVENFIVINRAYRTPVVPYQCSPTSPADTLTEYCGSEVRFPVSVGGTLYDGTLRYLPERAGLVFAVDSSKLKLLADGGQPRATFTDNTGMLRIPSVRVGGIVYVNVILQLTNPQLLEFTVVDFTPR